MKQKLKVRINYTKERVVFSDTLPYETPIIFSNQHFYHFLVDNQIQLEDHKIAWKAATKQQPSIIDAIIKLLFDFDESVICSGYVDPVKLKTIPFTYKISHKEKDFRELNIIHPKGQLALVDFYNQYKYLITYYANISPFSIRKPHKVAKFVFYNDKTHKKNVALHEEHETIEIVDKNYENLKTFFAYKSYSNIYKFYESYEYHQCEKKYNKLLKLDIIRCFDSIYTHSLAWALLNRSLVKDEILKADKTFAGEFDKLMQAVNYGETNGIIIGPEFSRIFAELLLQQIDKNVFNVLSSKKLYHKIDYEIFRYVDDFFIFYKDENTKENIIESYRLQLKLFKMHLNDQKMQLYEIPIVTGITIAKHRISYLLSEYMGFELEEEALEELDSFKIKYNLYASSNRMITQFKIIIKETSIEYKDILNYTLASIDRKVLRLLEKYEKIQDKRPVRQKLIQTLLEILDFTFFIYANAPRVNSTIKLCMILSKIIVVCKRPVNFDEDHKNLIFKKIYDSIYFILQKNRPNVYKQVETLSLLLMLPVLGKSYRLPENALRHYFGIEQNIVNNELNYFSIIVFLFYIQNIKRYEVIKNDLKTCIFARFEAIDSKNRKKHTELTLLLFDLFSCPFLDSIFKRELLTKFYNISDTNLQNGIIQCQKFWFTKWTEFDLVKALAAKKSREVY